MISWAIYSVFLMNWKSKFDLLTRFGLMAIAGVICLLPMYYVEGTDISLISKFNFSTRKLLFCSGRYKKFL